MANEKEQPKPEEEMLPYKIQGAPNDFVDIQIATAKRYPRNMAQVKQRIISALTPDVAAKCHYHLPPRENEDGTKGKPISGGNIRLAEIGVQAWGNCRVQVLDSGEEKGFVLATCRVIDLESNFAAEIPAKRRITRRSGKRYTDDMVGVTTNAAYAIAYRNGVRKLLGPYWEWLCETAIAAARADVDKNLAKRRKDAIEFFTWRGINVESLLKKMGREKTEDITADDVMTLLGYVNAVESGEANIEEVFEVEIQRPPDTGGHPMSLKKTEPTPTPPDPQGDPSDWLDETERPDPEKTEVDELFDSLKVGIEGAKSREQVLSKDTMFKSRSAKFSLPQQEELSRLIVEKLAQFPAKRATATPAK